MRSLTKTATSADTATASASGWQTIKRIAPYLWPKGELWVKQRVVFALLLLLVSKIVSVCTPYLYKKAVDALTSPSGTDIGSALLLGAVGLRVA